MNLTSSRLAGHQVIVLVWTELGNVRYNARLLRRRL